MKVIVDCDTGNDDAWAIFALLRAEEKCDYNIVAITCVNGNTNVENAVRNTLKVLEISDRLDIPVYAGAKSSLIVDLNAKEAEFHGLDGLNDVYSEKPSIELAQKKHAVEAIKDLIEDNPNDVTILSLAPLTNIALLFKLYPEISAKISSLYIMGGNHHGVGNFTRCSEFNFYSDPEAAHIVFSEATCPVDVFTWEACIDASIPLLFNEWRMNVLASNKNKMTNFLDPVEIIAYKDFTSWMPCDLFLACTFIIPKIIKKSESHHITIELAGHHARGMMVIDHLKTNVPNALIIKEINVEMFKEFMMWTCEHDINFNFNDA